MKLTDTQAQKAVLEGNEAYMVLVRYEYETEDEEVEKYFDEAYFSQRFEADDFSREVEDNYDEEKFEYVSTEIKKGYPSDKAPESCNNLVDAKNKITWA